jgi:hypothetical protein
MQWLKYETNIRFRAAAILGDKAEYIQITITIGVISLPIGRSAAAPARRRIRTDL